MRIVEKIIKLYERSEDDSFGLQLVKRLVLTIALPIVVSGWLFSSFFRQLPERASRVLFLVLEGRPNKASKLPSRSGIAVCVLEIVVALYVSGPATYAVLMRGVRYPQGGVLALLLANALILLTVAVTIGLVRIRVTFIRRCRGRVVAAKTNSAVSTRSARSYEAVSRETALRDQGILFSSGLYELAEQYATVVRIAERFSDREYRTPAWAAEARNPSSMSYGKL